MLLSKFLPLHQLTKKLLTPCLAQFPLTQKEMCSKIDLCGIDGQTVNIQRNKMRAFFVQIKCELGKSYDVATAIADAEIASEIFSTAGEFDLLVKFYLKDGDDIGHFVAQKLQVIAGIRETFTIVTFKAF
jgi:DNA-binding Lrp family transcriptional regulator